MPTVRLIRMRLAIEVETRFGVGATFKERREHEVMDEDWSVSPITRNLNRAMPSHEPSHG